MWQTATKSVRKISSVCFVGAQKLGRYSTFTPTRPQHLEHATALDSENRSDSDSREIGRRSIRTVKIDAKLNTADICTKALASEAVERHLKAMGFEALSGRSSIAKAVT